MIRISVCVPCHNVSDCVGSLEKAIVAQDNSQTEYLLVDDGSTDDTKALLERLANGLRARGVAAHAWSLARNCGQSVARQTAVSHATGRYVAFMDADDALPGGYYGRLGDLLDLSGADIACSAILERCPDGTERKHLTHAQDIDGFFANDFNTVVFNSLCNKMFRRHLFGERLAGCERPCQGEDLLWVVQLLGRACRIAFSNDVFYGYVRRRTSMSRRVTDSIRQDRLEVVSRLAAVMDGRHAASLDALKHALSLDLIAKCDMTRREYVSLWPAARTLPSLLRDRRTGLVGKTAVWLAASPLFWPMIAGTLRNRFRRGQRGWGEH